MSLSSCPTSESLGGHSTTTQTKFYPVIDQPPPSSKQLRTFYIVLTLFHVTKHELSTDPLPPSLVNVVCERFLWEFFLANCCTAAMRSAFYMWHLHMSWPIRRLTFTFVFRIHADQCFSDCCLKFKLCLKSMLWPISQVFLLYHIWIIKYYVIYSIKWFVLVHVFPDVILNNLQ